jgi:hypothetical protein
MVAMFLSIFRKSDSSTLIVLPNLPKIYNHEEFQEPTLSGYSVVTNFTNFVDCQVHTADDIFVNEFHQRRPIND